MRHFLDEVADEVTEFRTRFKTLRTLRRLPIPGWLTAEYLAGHRQPYLTPFKTYLVCAAIFFLSAPWAGFTLGSMIEGDRSGVLRDLATARGAERQIDPAAVNARFDSKVKAVYTITLGVAAIVVALALQLLFRKQRWPFGAHLIFALHYISFIYLVTVAVGLGRRAGLSIDVVALGGYALIVPYLILALRRVYGESRAALAWKGALLLLLTILVNNFASFAAIRITFALV